MTDTALEDEIFDLRFYLQRCVRYHMRRASFFTKWQRCTSFIGVLFGSAALAVLIDKVPDWIGLAAAFLVTVVSALDLVVGTGQHAWIHNDLRKRFLELEGRLSSENHTRELVAELNGLVRRIEADEPPARELLNLLARNDVIRSWFPKERADKEVSDIGWFKRSSANFIDWDIDKY